MDHDTYAKFLIGKSELDGFNTKNIVRIYLSSNFTGIF